MKRLTLCRFAQARLVILRHLSDAASAHLADNCWVIITFVATQLAASTANSRTSDTLGKLSQLECKGF